jgi:hypothetical protein
MTPPTHLLTSVILHCNCRRAGPGEPPWRCRVAPLAYHESSPPKPTNNHRRGHRHQTRQAGTEARATVVECSRHAPSVDRRRRTQVADAAKAKQTGATAVARPCASHAHHQGPATHQPHLLSPSNRAPPSPPYPDPSSPRGGKSGGRGHRSGE